LFFHSGSVYTRKICLKQPGYGKADQNRTEQLIELVSKPYLNVIPGLIRRRMTVATQCRMAVVTRGSFCHSGLDPESVRILNPQYHSVRGRQVQNDKVNSESPPVMRRGKSSG